MVTIACCSPRDRDDGGSEKYTPAPTRRSVDSGGLNAVLSRIVKLEEQVDELRILVRLESLTNSRRPHVQLSESQLPAALNALHEPPAGRIQAVSLDSHRTAVSEDAPSTHDDVQIEAKQSVAPLTHDSVQIEFKQSCARADASSTQSVEATQDLGIKSIDVKEMKNLVEGAISDWDKQMHDTKSRLEQAVSLLSARVERTLSGIIDLMTSSIKKSSTLEARIMDLEESPANREPKTTSPVVPPAQVNDSMPRVEDDDAVGLEGKVDYDELAKPMPIDRGASQESALNFDREVSQEEVRTFNHEVILAEEEKTVACPRRGTKKSLSRKSAHKREKVMMVEPRYIFGGSIWDAFLFANEPEVGSLGSLVLWILFILNLCMLISFSVICSSSLIENPFDQEAIQGLKEFRKFTSHDNRYQDLFTGESLARRLCHDDSLNYFVMRENYGTTQSEVLHLIDDYLGGSGDLFVFRGQLMCLLALVCWAFVAAREAKKTWHFHSAMGGFRVTRYSSLSEHNGRIIIDSLGYVQYAKYITIVLFRWILVLLTLSMGCMWLCYTVRIEELLLNAVALEFVLRMDELVYEAAVPRQTKVFITSLEPAKERHWKFYKGIDQISIIVIIGVPTIAIVFWAVNVLSLVDMMLQARSVLCGDDLDFVFGLDTTGFVWFETTSADEFLESHLHYAQEATIWNRINNRPALEVGMSLPFLWLSTARSMENLNWENLVDLNYGCQDILFDYGGNVSNQFGEAHMNWFRRQLMDKSISSCEDLRAMGLCGRYRNYGPEARWLCSDTCECKSPTSISPPHDVNGGCPESCEHSGEYARKLHAMGCVDMTLEALQASSFWEGWANYTKDAMASLMFSTFADRIHTEMMTLGCAFVVNRIDREMLCSGSTISGMRALAPVCPIACGCAVLWLEQCPLTCIDKYLDSSQNSTAGR